MHRKSNCNDQGSANSDPVENTAPRLLNIDQVSKIVGLSRSSIYRFISEERFPRPVKLTDHISRWNVSEVNQWVDSVIQNGGLG
jgi:prophage regulatory protein